MRKPKLKICGITRPEDVRRLNTLAVDYAGFIFCPVSERYVSRRAAVQLSRLLDPSIQPVGVFVDSPVAEIVKVSRSIRAAVVQIHRRLAGRELRTLLAEGFRVAQCFHISAQNDWREVAMCKSDFVLVDNASSAIHGAVGGTGRTFNWELLPRRKVSNLILAGGLNEGNFRRGAKLFHPAILDVNSGVERSPGVKSATKLKRFVEKYHATRWGPM